MKVIGIAGQMQNGKDTVADFLANSIEWGRYAFATRLKKDFCNFFGLNADFIEKWKTKPYPPPGFKKSVRKGLQFVGDGFREIVPTIWIDRCFDKLNEMGPTVLSDVRYLNEVNAINLLNKDADGLGIVILVCRPGFENDDPNGSESQLRPYVNFFKNTGREGVISEWDMSCQFPDEAEKIDIFLVNDGTILELYEKIDRIVVPFINERLKANDELG